MGFEFVLSAERFAASGALEGFLSGVSAPVTTLKVTKRKMVAFCSDFCATRSSTVHLMEVQ